MKSVVKGLFFPLSRKETTLMTAASGSSVAIVDTSDCDSPQEITEACKSPRLCQQGRLGDCSWTVRHPDTAEKGGKKNNIVK